MMSRPLIITGCGRSGTSAVAQVLHKLSVSFPGNLLEKDEFNPGGYYEEKNILILNREILGEHGGSLYEPVYDIYKSKYEKNLVGMFEELEDKKAPYWGIKDPQISLMLPLYLRLLNPVFVFVVRKPESVVASYKNYRPSMKYGHELWSTYNYAIMSFLAFNEGVVVDYDYLVERPHKAVKNLCDRLKLPHRYIPKAVKAIHKEYRHV